MTRLDFNEAATMARKIVEAGTAVSSYSYAKDFVVAAFEKTIRFAQGINEAADSESDNFNDGLNILEISY